MRKRRQLAVVRSLWERRDEVARRRDIAPGRVLPDAALVSAALASPRTEVDLVALPVWGGRSMRRQTATWLPAIEEALDLPDAELPDLKTPHEGPPPARSWGERDPAAAARLAAARAAVGAIAEQHGLPVENLLAPDAVRRLAWAPPAAALAEGGTDTRRRVPAGPRRAPLAGRADGRRPARRPGRGRAARPGRLSAGSASSAGPVLRHVGRAG